MSSEHVAHAELLDGSSVSLRRLKTGDFEAIVELFDTLTDEDRYRRFFTPHPAHLEDWARSLAIRSRDRYALGAFESGRLIGVANYVRSDGPGEAEVAVVVAHDEHMRGVGTVLLHRLGAIARRAGIHHLVADVLAENYLMLKVMSEAGWPLIRHLQGSVIEIDADLDSAT